MRIILNSALIVTCVACAAGKPELTEEQQAVSEKLASKFGNQEVLVYTNDTLPASQEVLNYYTETGFAPIWIEEEQLTENGTEMLDLVNNARQFGLIPAMFEAKTINQMKDSSLLDTEILLTNAFFLMITHVDLGCIDTATLDYIWKKEDLAYSLSDELDRVFQGEKPRTVITEKQPAQWEYGQLQMGLGDFLANYELDTNRYSIPKFKEDSVKCYAAAREALMGHGFLDSTNYENDSIFIAHLKDFQRLNGLKDDAIVGRWTSKALENSNQDRFLQAALSMEKWKWKNDTIPSKYIRVNIPEFTLYFVDNDTLKRKHRVIVGSQKTPTPEFSATMRRMVSNPIWHVPYSIASTEILYGAKKDSAYLKKRGYKIYKGGVEQDAAKVDWSKIKQGSFPYRVKQNSGWGNSLGRLKFLFPNTNYVFIHDTPSKYLFKNDVRAYSHGCVRLDDPFALGREILATEQHEVAPDTLDSLIARGRNHVVELEEPFPVFLEYFTATGDSSGQVVFHPDIYGRDNKYLVESFKKF